MSYRDDSSHWPDQNSYNEAGSFGRSQRNSPSVRRNLYDGPGTSFSQFDLMSEMHSVREETAFLTSRALKEGIARDGSTRSPDVMSGNPDEHIEDPTELGDILLELPAENTPLTAVHSNGRRSHKSIPDKTYGTTTHHGSKSAIREALSEIYQDLTFGNCARYTPSVILGLLLNILDGLSYGMILFPLGTTVFANLQSAGLSMFYVSTVVSQLVFSLGASSFKACIGSEMIEIVPFLHAMALTISKSIGEDKPEAVLATTVTAFAISSVVTGAVFFLLGYLKLGALVGFFPRHILVGCIGGVGYFLIATGFEVSARLEGSLHYDLETLKYMFQPEVFAKWGSCFALAIVLLVAERKVPSALVVPGILIGTFILFHIIVALVPGLTLDSVRDAGWIFEAQQAGEPWYYFYELYRFDQVYWQQILETVPAMLALTFFGLIHVPINIPALAAATKDDNVDVNRELIAHGISNTLSGCIGSVQNYLVYTNSVLFIKSGADSKLSGLMLALATFLIMIAGPVIIGYIPVIVVAALIFMMGWDLVGEALVDTWGKVDAQEYLTIVAIVVTMGGYDFVVGILVGIVLACLSFVITSAAMSPIGATFTGDTARSTVNRHPTLQKFLAHVGTQIYIMKLHGSLFFGTNVRIESGVRGIIEDESMHIKYLIIDVDHVTDIDFCSADTFARIKRLLDAQGIQMILSGAQQSGNKVRGLKAVDLVRDENSDAGSNVHLFSDLNTALEYCENQFLTEFYRHRDQMVTKAGRSGSENNRNIPYSANTRETRSLALPKQAERRSFSSLAASYGTYGVTPRGKSLRIAAENTVNEDIQAVSKWDNMQQPMPLLMQILDGISDKDAQFWYRVVPFFVRKTVRAGEIVSDFEVNSPGFFLIESGILQTAFPGRQLTETVLAGTTVGELNFFTGGPTTTRVTADTNAVLWQLTPEKFKELQESLHGPELAAELLHISLVLTRVRFNTVTSYLQVLSA